MKQRPTALMAPVLILLLAAAATGSCRPAEPDDLRTGCLRAAVRAIQAETARLQGWIAQRKSTGSRGDLAELESSLKARQADLAKYQAMKPADFPLPEPEEAVVWFEDAKPGFDSILYFEGLSRSGPWLHMAGMAGDGFASLKPEDKKRTTFYKVYPRSYFGMDSFYVYISERR
jgi:hypothetical protein